MSNIVATCLMLAVASPALAADDAQPTGQVPGIEQAEMLVPFGGRVNFSPDGRKIVFVGKTYGDAYELDLATRRLRNLTRGFPHQGIMRIQYLPDGNFLVTAPRIHSGPNSRAQLELWLLDKSGIMYHLQEGRAGIFRDLPR